MIDEKIVRELAEERLATFDGFIVDLKVGAGNEIKLLIDADVPISISDCMSVSRNVEHNLDRETEDFSLEVSSAGLDQPFKHIRQYYKNIGREVKVIGLDGSKVEGLLSSADENAFQVTTKRKERIEGRKAKHWVEEVHTFEYSEIKETKVIIGFK
jgi:ribosome maturation factor RimP